eukprot:COSAG01_NODE_4699_length_4804_cov_17.017216_1_plen_58_part_00
MALCDALRNRKWAKAQEMLDGDAATTLAREKDKEYRSLPLYWAQHRQISVAAGSRAR